MRGRLPLLEQRSYQQVVGQTMGAREGAGGIERAWGKVVVHSKLLTFSGGIIEMHRVGGEKMFVMKRLYHASPASSTLP